MAMPFTQEEYFGSLSRYNLDVWPAQVVLYLIAFLILALAYKKRRAANVALAFFWVWLGAAYFIRQVGPFSTAGYVEGAVCIIQAFLLLKVRFSPRTGWIPSAGGVLIFYAMVAYPTLGTLLGHGWPRAELIGLHGPTTIYTLGLLMWAAGSVPCYVLVIPLIMAVGGAIIGVSFGAYESLGLLVAGALAAAWAYSLKKESPLDRLEEESRRAG
jgi:hypothetical protein